MLEFNFNEAKVLIKNIQSIEKAAAILRKQVENKIRPKAPAPHKCCCCIVEITTSRGRQNSFDNEDEDQMEPITRQPTTYHHQTTAQTTFETRNTNNNAVSAPNDFPIYYAPTNLVATNARGST